MKQLALFLSLMLMSSIAFAKKGKGGDGEGKRGEKMRAELGLSDEQLEKMKEIREKRKAAHEGHREKVKAARDDFQAAMKNPKATKSELVNKFEALEKIQAQGKRDKFEMMLEIRSLLDEKQIAKFQEKRGEWRKKWKEGRKGKREKND
ncbi:MAG: Spy/CpxP family protein refolding chaperone [Bacteriovoracia bacterium]